MTPEYIEILLKFTKIKNKELIAATVEHLYHGQTQESAAAVHGVLQTSLARLVKKLRELDHLVTMAIKEKENE